MTKLDKLLDEIIHGKKELRFQELVKLLNRLDFRERTGKGSHVIFTHPLHGMIVIPKKSPVKRAYVNQVRELLAKHQG